MAAALTILTGWYIATTMLSAGARFTTYLADVLYGPHYVRKIMVLPLPSHSPLWALCDSAYGKFRAPL